MKGLIVRFFNWLCDATCHNQGCMMHTEEGRNCWRWRLMARLLFSREEYNELVVGEAEG